MGDHGAGQAGDESRPPHPEAGGFTYDEVGATRSPSTLPPDGYRLMRVSTRVGEGAADFRTASRALLEWRLHRAMGVRAETGAARAEPGVRVTVVVGAGPFRLTAPCRLIWVEEQEARTAWGYGTLPGHPVRGEESFEVTLEPDGAVRLNVTAFSRPALWYTRAAGSLGRAAQRYYARRCGRVMRRLVEGR
ncbi:MULTISPECIES: DUF1990 family protein [Streptomyces]|uniref:DUF1990 family protein n=1 Tax=Streptomyces TaxID=1883 RepID=UPI000CD4CBA4|nr:MULTISPECIES: DUF1990 domain-containing protein [Streptomyces]